MFAVVKTGGKQYRVKGADIIRIERLSAKIGDSVKLEDVLSTSDGDKAMVGTPTVSGAFVTAEVLAEQKADKVLIFKKRRRHNYRRKKGHRQIETLVRISAITVDGKTYEAEARKVNKQAAEPKAAAGEEAAKAKAPAKKTAAPKAKEGAAKQAAKKPAAKKAAKDETKAEE